jgi:serine/threonine protein kinase
MPLEKKPQAEPIRGYRLLEPLGAGGFGEVWKCEAPGGIHKAIKFVHGDLGGLDQDSKNAEEELRAVQLIKSIRHPFLLSIDRVESVGGELIIITELADQNLDELLRTYRGQGQPGLPRAELLAYLREAAEVLDLMNLKFDLQHLDVKPRNLFLVSNHVKVADFGLVNSLARGNTAKLELGAITPLYAAPELFTGTISRHCDQYSLAIAFQELLTGTLPYAGKNPRQLLLMHTKGEPDLSSLPAADRAIIARALAKDPAQRFPSCTGLVRALEGEGAPAAIPSGAPEAQTAVASQPMAETLTYPLPDAAKQSQRLPVLPPDVLADHVFVEALENSPIHESWKVQTPDGPLRVVKLLYGLGSPTPKLKENVLCLGSMHHPALVPSDVVSVEPGRLVLITDLVKGTLRDRFLKCRSQKLPGIRRDELQGDIRAAAEVLDYMYQQHGIQHLGLSPRCLIIDNGWLQITDFGLAQLLVHAAGQDLAQRNPRYAAPELFEHKITRSSDQVSLALIYAEMLTGIHPYRGGQPGIAPGVARPESSKGVNGRAASPELSALPPLDREVIARALDPDPARRWPSCTDMALALEGARPEESAEREKPDRFSAFLQQPRSARSAPVHTADVDLHRIIADIIAAAGGEVTPEGLDEIPELSADGLVLSHRFQVGLPLGAAKEKLIEFHKQCFGQLGRDDHDGCQVVIPLPTSLWGKWLGRQPALEVDLRLSRVNPASATPVEVAATLRAIRCTPKDSRKFLEETGPALIDNLRQLLLTNSNKRTQGRLLWPHPVKVIPVRSGEEGESVECRGKDISQGGLGFYLPEELDTADVLIELPNSAHADVTIPATLVRAKRCADGWYDVGALFRLPAVRKSSHEFCLK